MNSIKSLFAFLLLFVATLFTASETQAFAPGNHGGGFFSGTLDCAGSENAGTRSPYWENGWLSYDTLSGYCVAAKNLPTPTGGCEAGSATMSKARSIGGAVKGAQLVRMAGRNVKPLVLEGKAFGSGFASGYSRALSTSLGSSGGNALHAIGQGIKTGLTKAKAARNTQQLALPAPRGFPVRVVISGRLFNRQIRFITESRLAVERVGGLRQPLQEAVRGLKKHFPCLLEIPLQ